jgi:hypothetical protein
LSFTALSSSAPGHRDAAIQYFWLFPALPSEIQNKILNQTLQPRVVTARCSTDLQQWVSPDLPPAILLISTDARTQGLKIYQPAFGTATACLCPIYFNYDLDTDFLEIGLLELKADGPESLPDSGQIRSLIIEASVLLTHLTMECERSGK